MVNCNGKVKVILGENYVLKTNVKIDNKNVQTAEQAKLRHCRTEV